MSDQSLKRQIASTKAELRSIQDGLATMEAQLNANTIQYPVFRRDIVTGIIVKYTSLTKCTVVMTGNKGFYTIGYTGIRTKHTDKAVWEDVPYDRKRKLYHGQPVHCWDTENTHCRMIKFYNAIDKCTFSFNGKLGGLEYEHYKAMPIGSYYGALITAFYTLEKV